MNEPQAEKYEWNRMAQCNGGMLVPCYFDKCTYVQLMDKVSCHINDVPF